MDSRFFEIFKFAILICLLLITAALFAEESTIIDTIWTENTLQGAIGYHVQNRTYHGGIVPYGQDISGVGDSFDDYTDFNDICLRAYFSFPIQPIPDNSGIDSVYINAYQWRSIGNESGVNTFPIWYDNLYYPCNLYHVDYGLTFEPADFDPVIYDTLGAISTDASVGWRALNITDAYITDMNNLRPYCQLMFKFDILTDYDQLSDKLLFENSYGGIYSIHLKIIYSNCTSINEQVCSRDKFMRIYPNPCNKSFKVFTSNGTYLEEATLYNVRGQKVLSHKNPNRSEKELQIDLSNLDISPGIYILQTQIISKTKRQTIFKRITVW